MLNKQLILGLLLNEDDEMYEIKSITSKKYTLALGYGKGSEAILSSHASVVVRFKDDGHFIIVEGQVVLPDGTIVDHFYYDSKESSLSYTFSGMYPMGSKIQILKGVNQIFEAYAYPLRATKYSRSGFNEIMGGG